MKVGLDTHQHEAGECYTTTIADHDSVRPCGDPRCAEAVVGTRIYNHGDMANPSHFGYISRVIPAGRFAGQQLEITQDDTNETYVIHAIMVNPTFKGHSGTRIVSETAYEIWRLERLTA